MTKFQCLVDPNAHSKTRSITFTTQNEEQNLTKLRNLLQQYILSINTFVLSILSTYL